MKKALSLLVAFFALAALNVNAAMFETSPSPLQESSKDVVITFHADQSGVSGLMGLTTDLYAHIGVTTNKGQWQHVVMDWNKNSEKNLFKRVADNTYELKIGDLRTYFGMTDPDEHIMKICIIARKASASNASKDQTPDEFIDVVADGFVVAINSTPEKHFITTSTKFTFDVVATASSNIKLYVDDKMIQEVNDATSMTYTETFSTNNHEYVVKAVAKKGNETAEATYTVLYATESTQRNYPGGVPKMGTVKNADGSVTFCIAAPEKKSVVLIGSWDDYVPHYNRLMYYQDYEGFRYFWTTVSGLDNTSWYLYYYMVDGRYNVGDPYAKVVLDPNSEKWLEGDGNAWPERPQYPYDRLNNIMLACYKGNLDDYNWRVKNFTAPPRANLTIYELLFRDFTGTSGKSDGTIPKAIEKLPYLIELGVNAIQLMPVMEFDGNNSWGYATNFYMAVDKVYGSPDQLKNFIDICHENGIAVILDIVFNHTPGLHPWYQMYPASKNPFYNATCPHDWGVYNDIKQEYGLWEKHYIDVLTYWMTAYKVDGFRFDLVKGLADSNSYGSDKNVERWNQSLYDRMCRLHAAMKKVNPNVYHINEFLGCYDVDNALSQDGQLQWNKQTDEGSKYARGASGNLIWLNAEQCSRATHGTVDYFESHDEPWVGATAKASTVAALKGDENHPARMRRLGSMAAQLLMSPGPKMIWQFGELGFDAQQLTDANRTSPKEVHWEWLDDPDRHALFRNYAELNGLRRQNPDLFSATPVYTSFGSNQNPRAICLTYGNKEAIALINPRTNAEVTVTANVQNINSGNYRVVTASNGFTPNVQFNNGQVQVSIPANSFCVLSTKNVSGVENVEIDETSAVNVYSVNGTIIIDGPYDNVEVYNLSGARMGSMTVAPGCYVVVVDGNPTKLMVR